MLFSNFYVEYIFEFTSCLLIQGLFQSSKMEAGAKKRTMRSAMESEDNSGNEISETDDTTEDLTTEIDAATSFLLHIKNLVNSLIKTMLYKQFTRICGQY